MTRQLLEQWLSHVLSLNAVRARPIVCSSALKLQGCHLKYLALFYKLLNQQDVSDLEGMSQGKEKRVIPSHFLSAPLALT